MYGLRTYILCLFVCVIVRWYHLPITHTNKLNYILKKHLKKRYNSKKNMIKNCYLQIKAYLCQHQNKMML